MLRNPNSFEYTFTSNEVISMYMFLKEHGYNNPELMNSIATGIEADDQLEKEKLQWAEIPADELLAFANTRFAPDEVGVMGNRKFVAVDATKLGLSCYFCAFTNLCDFNSVFCNQVKCNNPKNTTKIIFEET